MKVLVTGGLGFVGSHISKRLSGMNHHVTIWDDWSSPCDMQNREANATYCVDITKDSLEREPQFDVVFHTAAIARTVPCVNAPLRCHEVNATGSLKIFDRYIGARVVHCSSNVCLGVPTPYRASKIAAEEYLQSYNNLYDANIIGLRFSNVIGPHLRKGDGAVLSSLRDCRAANGYVEVTGDGTQTRNFTSVSDVVDACMIAAFDSQHKGIIDITSGRVTSMNEFAAFYKCPVRYIGDRRGDTKDIHQSPEEALKVLGWKAKVSLEEEMERSLA